VPWSWGGLSGSGEEGGSGGTVGGCWGGEGGDGGNLAGGCSSWQLSTEVKMMSEKGGHGKCTGTKSAGGQERQGVNVAAARDNGGDKKCNGAGRPIGRCKLPIAC